MLQLTCALRHQASNQIKRHHFFETGKFLVQVLSVLKPANAILQSQPVDMCSASEVVGAALESLKKYL